MIATYSSPGVDDACGLKNIPSPLEVSSISYVDSFFYKVFYLAFDIFGSSKPLLIVTRIRLSDIGRKINHILTCKKGSHGS